MWLNRSAKASGIAHNEQCPKKHLADMSELLRTTWISCDFVLVFFSRPSHENYLSILKSPAISTTWASQKTSRSRKLHILPRLSQRKSSQRELAIFSKNTEFLLREIPTKIETRKMEVGGGAWLSQETMQHDRQIASEIQILRKLNKKMDPAFFGKCLKDEFHQGVFCTNVSTIMQVPAQLSFGTRCA